MKVCLVGPPTVTDFEDPAVAESEAIRLIAQHAPLGVLSLAAVLDQIGNRPELVDLNQWYYAFLRSDKPAPPADQFCGYVCDRLLTTEFDVLGLSTICSSYPLTLRIAGAVKAARPGCVIVVGGPQASVVDIPTLDAFRQVDFVVRGEAERTFPALLAALEDGGRFDVIPGIAYRDKLGPRKTPNAPVIDDLDSLPLPAFHLFPGIRECQYVPLELGRGCPFACTFCSTNDFFRRNFRLKSPAVLIEQMRSIRRDYGVFTFDLIHDMFTVDRKRVIAFCEALLESGETFYWNCSARTDCVDEEMMALMAKAGCRGIFFGIETGSARLQRVIKKDLDLPEATRMIEIASRHAMQTAVSLITGFPDEAEEDVCDTAAFFVDSLRHDHAEPQLHLLAPLVETPLFSQFRDQLVFDDIQSDMSHQGWEQGKADRELIAAHRDVFGNFYSLPTPHLDRPRLKELREFLLNGAARFRWLLVAIHQDRGIVNCFDAWRRWRLTNTPMPPDSAGSLAQYYSRIDFVDEFAAFLRSEFVSPGKNVALEVLLEHDTAVGKVTEEVSLREANAPPTPSNIFLEPDTVVGMAEGARLVNLTGDYYAVIRCLKRKGNIRRVRRRPTALVIRPSVGGNFQVLQLNSLSGRLLQLCDGRRRVDEIVASFGGSDEKISGVPIDKACRFGLEILRQQGLIVSCDEVLTDGATGASH
jgi:radical SAM superfamily enzyme YgiQ (UPF0313 family)